jgi:hypothetical protein
MRNTCQTPAGTRLMAAARARWLRSAGIASAVTALTLIGITTSASAATTAPAPVSTRVVPAQLTLDCVNMTAQARQYAVAHHYCPAAGAGTAMPYSTGYASGDCGTSFISIVDEGGGYARFSWGFSSSLGTVAYRGLGVNWLNERFGNFGGWPDNKFMWSSGYSSTPRTVGTGEGNVFGDVTGYVVLWWGGTCDLLAPETTQKIT